MLDGPYEGHNLLLFRDELLIFAPWTAHEHGPSRLALRLLGPFLCAVVPCRTMRVTPTAAPPCTIWEVSPDLTRPPSRSSSGPPWPRSSPSTRWSRPAEPPDPRMTKARAASLRGCSGLSLRFNGATAVKPWKGSRGGQPPLGPTGASISPRSTMLLEHATSRAISRSSLSLEVDSPARPSDF